MIVLILVFDMLKSASSNSKVSLLKVLHQPRKWINITLLNNKHF